MASEIALQESLQSGLGPVQSNSALDYLKLLWSDALIADETNTYARRSKWIDVTTDEVWTFFGIIITMGIHRLPRITEW